MREIGEGKTKLYFILNLLSYLEDTIKAKLLQFPRALWKLQVFV